MERGDRAVWGTTGNNQIGILQGALPVRYEYDTVLDETCSNQQVFMLTAVQLSTTAISCSYPSWIGGVSKIKRTYHVPENYLCQVAV